MSQIKNEENTVKNFIELEKNELKQVDGGLLAGAILGGTGGLIVGAAKGIVTGNLTGNQLWKCYTAGAIGGATIGAYTPV